MSIKSKLHRYMVTAASCGLVLFAHVSALSKEPITDEIRAEIIRASIASYPGNCPCPYNLDRAGRQCGRRSAYIKPGGRSPLCYPRDVTDEMIAKYRVNKSR